MNRDVEHWEVSKKAVASEAGVVAAQHHLAARAGAGMLANGGNAVIELATSCLAGPCDPGNPSLAPPFSPVGWTPRIAWTCKLYVRAPLILG